MAGRRRRSVGGRVAGRLLLVFPQQGLVALPDDAGSRGVVHPDEENGCHKKDGTYNYERVDDGLYQTHYEAYDRAPDYEGYEIAEQTEHRAVGLGVDPGVVGLYACFGELVHDYILLCETFREGCQAVPFCLSNISRRALFADNWLIWITDCVKNFLNRIKSCKFAPGFSPRLIQTSNLKPT